MKTFEEITLTKGDKKVVLEWIGEGNEGDYNEDDSEDEQLIRFSCSEFVHRREDGNLINDWDELESSSYCTQLPVGTSMKTLIRAAAEVMEAIQDVSYKRRLEELSWMCPEDFQENIKKGC